MAEDPFTLSTAQPTRSDPFTLGGSAAIAPNDPFTLSTATGGEPRRGFISTVVNELARDVVGGFRVGEATAGEILNMLGANVPTTFEDLTTRDIKGATMLAALGVGGVTAGAARGLPFIQALGGNAASRAAATATTETLAGAAFGLVRPIEESETRLKAVVGDAAFGAGIGAGASFMKSAVKATIGAKVAQIKKNASHAQLARAIQRTESEQLVKEAAGVELLNPTTQSRMGIRRLANGKTQITRFSEKGGHTRETVEDFPGAIADAVQQGFTENLGFFNTRRLADSILGKLDEGTLNSIQQTDDFTSVIQPIRIEEYQAVRLAAKAAKESTDELNVLAGEALAPANALGAPRLTDDFKAQLVRELGITAKQFREMGDADLLREGIKRGAVTVESMNSGMSFDDLARELVINGQVPKNEFDIVVNRTQDLVAGSLLLPSRIAKLHPVVEPLIQQADDRLRQVDQFLEPMQQRLSTLKQRVSMQAAKKGVEIIDSTADIEDIAVARQEAIRKAAATGDPEVEEFVRESTDILENYFNRAGDAGILDEGRSGYFPIHNANKWKLEVTSFGDGPEVQFQGFWPSKKRAMAELERVRASNPGISANISPRGFWNEAGGKTRLDPEAYGKLHKKLKEVFTEEFGPEDAKDLSDSFLQRNFGIDVAGKKTTGFAKQRKLGIRDFSKDPFETLEIYTGEMERAIALRDFEQVADRAIAQIPESQSALRAWGEQYKADVLGRPRPVEQAFDAILQHVGIDVPDRALKRYSAMLRKYQAFSRLGGFASGIVNSTQVAINTFPVLGGRYTLKGFEILQSPAKFRRAEKTLLENGVDIGHFVPLSDEGLITHFGSPKAALKEGRFLEALHRMSLFIFNGTEKTNRLVTAWGAFNKGLDQGLDAKAAAGMAEEIVNRTQFNYRQTNMPEILRSPVGSVVFQFKSFLINEIDFLASMNQKEFARFSAAAMSVGGVSLFFNMPGAEVVKQSSRLFMDEKLDESLKLRADDPLSKAITFGLPGLVDIDVSDFVGVGSLADITGQLFGPSVSDAQNIASFIKDAAVDVQAHGFVRRETKNAALQQLAPSALRRFQRGQAIYQTGEVRNHYTGKLIYKPQDRLKTAVAQTVGFPTVQMQQERVADEVVERVRLQYLNGRTSFAKEAAQAMIQGNRAEAQKIKQEALASGYPLSEQTMRYWIKALQEPSTARRLRRTPKDLREAIAEQYEATGLIEAPRR